MEHKCLPNIRDKCPDCEGPECTYMEGSECEALNLAYLAPDIRQELKAYRDTGLEPEEILTAKEVAEVACALNLLKEYQSVGSVEHFRELSQAEKDGRLVAHLPGEKVYDRFGTPWIIESAEIHLMSGEMKQLFRCGHPGTDDYYSMYEDEILTKEEAEAALKKKEETGNEAVR